MSKVTDKAKSTKKSVHPIVWLSIGAAIFALLQAFVFPKVSFPT